MPFLKTGGGSDTKVLTVQETAELGGHNYDYSGYFKNFQNGFGDYSIQNISIDKLASTIFSLKDEYFAGGKWDSRTLYYTVASGKNPTKKQWKKVMAESGRVATNKLYDGQETLLPSLQKESGRKTEKEKFSGAEYTLTNEALMYNGVALQSGTSHYFGQKFSEAYGIKFTNKENKEEYAYQTSWGTTTRMIGGLIMVHSDDYGLVLPPKIAPKQVAIIPIGNDEEVLNLCNEYKEKLNKEGIEAYVDLTDKSPGFKFAEAEVNGIPVRIELGKRDLENNKITFARRDTREKIEENINIDIVSYTKNLLETIQKDMYERAKKRRDELTFEAHNKEEIKKILNTQPGFIHAMWCGDIKCEEEIKQIKGCKSRCIVNEKAIDEKCVCCGKDAKYHVIWGIQY